MKTLKTSLLVVTLISVFSFVTAISSYAGSVRGYFRSNGTYVSPYLRTQPTGNPYKNYNYPGNYNPNKGKITSGSREKYLERYYNHKAQNRKWR